MRSVDPFEHVTESDEEDASPNELLIDQDNEDDDMIDIDIYITKSQLFFVTVTFCSVETGVFIFC